MAVCLLLYLCPCLLHPQLRPRLYAAAALILLEKLALCALLTLLRLPGLAAGGVNVGGVSVNISLSGSAEPSRALELSGARIADQVAQAIADGLERALRNMP